MANIPDGLINDATYKCGMCEQGIMCFTTDGNTEFCPNCGARSDQFEDYEEDKE